MQSIERISHLRMALYGMGYSMVTVFIAFHTTSMPLWLSSFTDSKATIGLILGFLGFLSPFSILAGWLSDRTNTPIGKRKPYIAFGVFIICLTFFYMPQIKTLFGAIVAAIILSAIFYFAGNPYWSLAADIAPPEQRGTTTGYVSFLGGIGYIIYYSLGARLWDINQKLSFYLVIAIMVVSASILFIGVKEPKTSYPIKIKKIKRGLGTRMRDSYAFIREIFKETMVMKYFLAESFWFVGIWGMLPWFTSFISKDLGVSEGEAIMVMLSYAIVSLIFSLPMGMAGDKFGRKRVSSIGLLLMTLTFLSLYFVQNLLQATTVIAILGISWAILLSANWGLMFNLFPKTRVAEYFGYHSLVVSIGRIGGPLVSGYIIDSLGYRAIFLIMPLFVLIGLILFQNVQEVEKEPVMQYS